MSRLIWVSVSLNNGSARTNSNGGGSSRSQVGRSGNTNDMLDVSVPTERDANSKDNALPYCSRMQVWF